MNNIIFKIGRLSLDSEGQVFNRGWGGNPGGCWAHFGTRDQLIINSKHCSYIVIDPEEFTQLMKIKSAWIKFYGTRFRENIKKLSYSKLISLEEELVINISSYNRQELSHGRTKQELQAVRSQIRRIEEFMEPKIDDLTSNDSLEDDSPFLDYHTEMNRQHQNFLNEFGINPINNTSEAANDPSFEDHSEANAVAKDEAINTAGFNAWGKILNSLHEAEAQLASEEDQKNIRMQSLLNSFEWVGDYSDQSVAELQEAVRVLMDDGRDVFIIRRRAGQVMERLVDSARAHAHEFGAHVLVVEKG